MNNSYGVSIKWLAVSSFEIRCGDTTIVTDPYITECPGTDLTWESVENCDIICLTHSHWDHITDFPRLAAKFQPKILSGEQTALLLAKWLNYNPSLVFPMYPNLELNFGDVRIRALYGRHLNLHKGFNDLCEHLGQNQYALADPGFSALQPIGCFEYRNYLFTLPNGTRILLWGNDPTVEQLTICKELKPDIAIIQRSVKPGEIAAKAEFAAALGCKIVIPHHHDFKKVDRPEIIDTFRKEYLDRVPDGIFLAPPHGQWLHL